MTQVVLLPEQHMKNPSVWNECIKEWSGAEEVFPVACRGLGYDVLVARSCSHLSIEAHVFLANPAISAHELMFTKVWFPVFW